MTLIFQTIRYNLLCIWVIYWYICQRVNRQWWTRCTFTFKVHCMLQNCSNLRGKFLLVLLFYISLHVYNSLQAKCTLHTHFYSVFQNGNRKMQHFNAFVAETFSNHFLRTQQQQHHAVMSCFQCLTPT